jgi:8-oxo-dGTP pyrophosphatase MutT (NUDIX family)
MIRHRIRAAALITDGDQILLVQHVHPTSGETWWVPPGGGLEAGDASVFACAQREVFEESGLTVTLSRIVYIREFVDREARAHNLELFMAATSFSGKLSIRHVQGNGPDEHYIRDVRWIARDALPAMCVYPEILKDRFWDDQRRGFPEMRYLGTQIG